MIKIEKDIQSGTDFVLRIGDKITFPMTESDLKDIHFCLTKTINGGPEHTQKSHFRILNDDQFDESKYNDGRSALWIGKRKWHINPKEERLLKENVNQLIEDKKTSGTKIKIWIHLNGKNEGPYTSTELGKMVAEGKITTSTPASTWLKVSDFI